MRSCLWGSVLPPATVPPPVTDSVFQWVTALATCGFSSTSLNGWTPSALLMLVAAMVVGGSSGSTAGGYKQDRAVTVGQALGARIAGVWQADEISGTHQLGGQEPADGFLRRYAAAASMGLLWLVTLGAGTLLLAVVVEPELPLSSVLFDATSALGSVGLSTGVASADLGWAGKLTFILLMWRGRLEILAVLALLQAPLRLGRRRVSR